MSRVLILDYGSQYTQLIARRIRELAVYSEIQPCTWSLEQVKAFEPAAIILSGGPASVYADGAPQIDPKVFELGIPVLGICYGLQLIAHTLGGRVERGTSREYGAAKLEVVDPGGPFAKLAAGAKLDVWMSHGDKLAVMPPGFTTFAKSEHSPHCAIGERARKIFGIQFHPEVVHTPAGKELLAAFLFDVAGVEASWTPNAFTDEAVRAVAARVGEDEHVICGLSGGVDSAVAAVICHKAIGDRLTCIFVDNGLLRKNEFEEVAKTFRDTFKIKLVAVDARQQFMSALSGMTDPEQKRKTIGRVFIEVFEAEAKKVQNARYLVQGTLYPDVIESVSFKGPSAVIKSHHNVGGLPERMHLKLIEPLREMFKDEVRAAGRTLGMPHHILGRHPFPGPGLAIRCLGDLSEKRLDVLREADAIFIDEIRKANLYDEIWQAFAVLLPVKSVGVMGDERTYEETCVIRAVSSVDGMTADWSRIPHEVLARISTRIINDVRGINRVTYDISSKPPATIEWE